MHNIKKLNLLRTKFATKIFQQSRSKGKIACSFQLDCYDNYDMSYICIRVEIYNTNRDYLNLALILIIRLAAKCAFGESY